MKDKQVLIVTGVLVLITAIVFTALTYTLTALKPNQIIVEVTNIPSDLYPIDLTGWIFKAYLDGTKTSEATYDKWEATNGHTQFTYSDLKGVIEQIARYQKGE